MSSPRANRVPERIKEIIAELVTTLKDPRIGFVTITDVRTTPDFSKATVFYTVLPRSGEDADPVGDGADQQVAQEQTAEGLASATPLLRRALGGRMRLRQVPTLEFVPDPVPAQGRRIEELINEARGQR
ncbi:MAG: 30S ribosome-binding factor RbfA [Actinobacteria bacterium]|nr:30S ribosome-binding factor RbfA [Actinomycetota bacterium]